MLLFALGISITINVILFVVIFIALKIVRKKKHITDEVVDFDMMKDFFGDLKL